jgi:hypothetical protein
LAFLCNANCEENWWSLVQSPNSRPAKTLVLDGNLLFHNAQNVTMNASDRTMNQFLAIACSTFNFSRFNTKMKFKPAIFRSLLAVGALALITLTTIAQGDDPVTPAGDSKPATAASEEKDPEKAFQELLNNTAMIGHFTIDGKPLTDSKEERYELSNVAKMEGDGDLWGMMARMKYGSKDVTFPVAVPVKFAGSVPIIHLDNFTIPGMGTFSACVVFQGDRYAGTWQHGEVGGHMFGRLERLPAAASKTPSEK